MEYLILSILILLFGAVFVLFVKEEHKLKLTSIFTFMASATALFPAIFVLLKGVEISNTVMLFSTLGPVTLAMDNLSAIFICVISIMSFIGTVYANGYIKPYLNKQKYIGSHCFFLLMLIASMLAVTVARNGLFFLTPKRKSLNLS